MNNKTHLMIPALFILFLTTYGVTYFDTSEQEKHQNKLKRYEAKINAFNEKNTSESKYTFTFENKTVEFDQTDDMYNIAFSTLINDVEHKHTISKSENALSIVYQIGYETNYESEDIKEITSIFTTDIAPNYQPVFSLIEFDTKDFSIDKLFSDLKDMSYLLEDHLFTKFSDSQLSSEDDTISIKNTSDYLEYNGYSYVYMTELSKNEIPITIKVVNKTL